MRTIVIGDIHGCYKALHRLLEEIRPTADDLLIFLGDYVDRGLESRQVIDRMLDLKKQCKPVFLLGNHEIMFREVLRGAPAWMWLEVGGHETLDSYGGQLSLIPASHHDFLNDLLPFYETDSHIFLHANYEAELPLEQQPEELLFWRHLSDSMPPAHFSGKHVYCGHTPQTSGEIADFGHLACLDTGCVMGLYLTALEIGAGKIWQSDKMGRLRR